MASIVKIGARWRALIRRKGFPNKCKTFPNKAQAEQWARGIEAAMDNGNAPAEPGRLTVADLIRTYREMREDSRPINDTSTERYTLETLEALLGDKLAGAQLISDRSGGSL